MDGFKWRLAGSAAALAILGGGAGFAQNVEAGGDDTRSDVITVTAQKREQSLIDVPMSLAVVTGQELEDAQVSSLQDLGNRVPGLAISQFGGRSDIGYMFIRGLGNNTATATLRAAAIVDDVPITNFNSLNSNFLDLQQVEVLRGPQSTLYGLTAQAGLVVATSRRPGDEFGGRASVQYTSVGDASVTGSLDIPLVQDRLTVGVSAFYEELDGFIENQLFDDDYDSGSSFSGRIRAIWTPTSDLEFDFNYTRDEADDDYGQALVPVDPVAYLNRFDNPLAPLTSDIPYTSLSPLGDFANAADHRGFGELTSNNFSLRASYAADGFDVVSVTSYREFERASSFDLGSQPGGVLPGSGSPSGFIQAGESSAGSESFYQELRLVSSGAWRARWVAGAVYYSEEGRYDGAFIRTVETVPSPPFPPIPGDKAFPFGDASVSDFSSFSVFGQVEYAFANSWEVLAGLRWETTEASGENRGGYDGAGGLGAPVPAEVADDTFIAEQSDDVLLPKLTLSYVPRRDLRVYATVARGWLPGAATGDPTTGDDGVIEPETSWTYELGANATFMGGRGTLSAAVFQTTLEDYQEAINVGPVDQFLENVPEVRIRGFEIEGRVQLTDRLSIAGGYAYNDATYEEFTEDFGPPFGVIDRSGNRLAAVPESNFNIRATFDVTERLFAEAEVVGAGEFLERQDRTGGDGTTLAGVQLQPAYGTFDGHEVLNVRAGYDADRWSVLVFANNVFDERYFTLTTNTFALAGPGDEYLLGAVGRPFEAGARLSVRF